MIERERKRGWEWKKDKERKRKTVREREKERKIVREKEREWVSVRITIQVSSVCNHAIHILGREYVGCLAATVMHKNWTDWISNKMAPIFFPHFP